MSEIVIAIEDPSADDVRVLLARHLAFANEHTPREHIHALDSEGLVDPTVTFFGLRRDGQLVAIGALRQLDATHGEIKSMHTSAAARRQGVGRAMVDHLIGVARQRGYGRLSLETGTMDAFEPARSLYASVGFEPCGPFGDYEPSPSNTFMTLLLGQ